MTAYWDLKKTPASQLIANQAAFALGSLRSVYASVIGPDGLTAQTWHFFLRDDFTLHLTEYNVSVRASLKHRFLVWRSWCGNIAHNNVACVEPPLAVIRGAIDKISKSIRYQGA